MCATRWILIRLLCLVLLCTTVAGCSKDPVELASAYAAECEQLLQPVSDVNALEGAEASGSDMHWLALAGRRFLWPSLPDDFGRRVDIEQIVLFDDDEGFVCLLVGPQGFPVAEMGRFGAEPPSIHVLRRTGPKTLQKLSGKSGNSLELDIELRGVGDGLVERWYPDNHGFMEVPGITFEMEKEVGVRICDNREGTLYRRNREGLITEFTYDACAVTDATGRSGRTTASPWRATYDPHGNLLATEDLADPDFPARVSYELTLNEQGDWIERRWTQLELRRGTAGRSAEVIENTVEGTDFRHITYRKRIQAVEK